MMDNFSVRPWGFYEVLYEAAKFKVKRIVVAPGERLSLQKHRRREEHWVCVHGEGSLILGDTVHQFNVGDDAFIGIGDLHRLENTGKVPLVVIETQIGEYVGEDDILRIKDDYSRGLETF